MGVSGEIKRCSQYPGQCCHGVGLTIFIWFIILSLGSSMRFVSKTMHWILALTYLSLQRMHRASVRVGQTPQATSQLWWMERRRAYVENFHVGNFKIVTCHQTFNGLVNNFQHLWASQAWSLIVEHLWHTDLSDLNLHLNSLWVWNEVVAAPSGTKVIQVRF